MDAAMNGEIDLAVVPLENAIEGSVNLTIDYLIHEQPLYIVGEITAPIRQHLLVHPTRKEAWEDIQKVYSHSHAIAQCHKFCTAGSAPFRLNMRHPPEQLQNT